MSASGDGVDGKVIAETVSGGDTCTSDDTRQCCVLQYLFDCPLCMIRIDRIKSCEPLQLCVSAFPNKFDAKARSKQGGPFRQAQPPVLRVLLRLFSRTRQCLHVFFRLQSFLHRVIASAHTRFIQTTKNEKILARSIPEV